MSSLFIGWCDGIMVLLGLYCVGGLYISSRNQQRINVGGSIKIWLVQQTEELDLSFTSRLQGVRLPAAHFACILWKPATAFNQSLTLPQMCTLFVHDLLVICNLAVQINLRWYHIRDWDTLHHSLRVSVTSYCWNLPFNSQKTMLHQPNRTDSWVTQLINWIDQGEPSWQSWDYWTKDSSWYQHEGTKYGFQRTK